MQSDYLGTYTDKAKKVIAFISTFEGVKMDIRNAHFKIGFTFSGKYRDKVVLPVVYALLEKRFKRTDIFYDFWYQVELNGVHGDLTLQDIYRNKCDCIVVLLSPDYREKHWPGEIEWPIVYELICSGQDDRLCLLGIDKVDINEMGLNSKQAIIEYIDDMSPSAIADFIIDKYNSTNHSHS